MNTSLPTLSLTLVAQTESSHLAEMVKSYLEELAAPLDYPYLPLYWEEAGRYPYFIRLGERIAGFALVRNLDSSGFELAEFCVLKKFRRMDVGRQAFAKLTEIHPGKWSVRSFLGSRQAVGFWSNVAKDYAKFSLEIDGDREYFGFTFDTGAAV
jgi:predicted acetyltransferase